MTGQLLCSVAYARHAHVSHADSKTRACNALCTPPAAPASQVKLHLLPTLVNSFNYFLLNPCRAQSLSLTGYICFYPSAAPFSAGMLQSCKQKFELELGAADISALPHSGAVLLRWMLQHQPRRCEGPTLRALPTK